MSRVSLEAVSFEGRIKQTFEKTFENNPDELIVEIRKLAELSGFEIKSMEILYDARKKRHVLEINKRTDDQICVEIPVRTKCLV